MLQTLDLKSVSSETHLPREFLFPDFPSRLDGEELESEGWRRFKSKNLEERFAACLASVGGFHDDIMKRAVILFNILAYIQGEELWRVDDTLPPAYATAFAKIARTRILGKDLSHSLRVWLEARRPKRSHRICSSVDLLNYCGDLLDGKCPGITYAETFS
jgi:hypothetical protein